MWDKGEHPSYLEECTKSLTKSDQNDYVLLFETSEGLGGLAWIKYPRKDMAVTFSYSPLE